jgi:hypothetical protein
LIVTTGLVPVVPSGGEMDCRDKPGNDDDQESGAWGRNTGDY